MKTIYFVLIVLFMTAGFTSCTADSIADNEDVYIEETSTTGEDGHYTGDGDEG